MKFVDARLAPVAAGLWLGTATTVLVLLHRNNVWLACYLIAISLGLGLGYWHLRLRLGDFQSQLLTFLGGFGFGVLIALLRVGSMFLSPAIDLAQAHSVVTAQVEVVGDPVPKTRQNNLDWSTTDVVFIPVKIVQLRHAASVMQGNVSAQLFSSIESDSFATLIPGTRIELVLRLQPSRSGSRYAVSAQALSAPQLIRGPPKYQWLASEIRDRLHSALLGQNQEARALIPGLTLGDTRFLTATLANQMRDAGLSHLIAVSGANVTILLGIVFVLLTRLSRLLQFGSALLVLSAFVVIVRPQPSVLRATAMGVVVLLGYVLRRKSDPVAALAIAICALVALDPILSSSYGFALSVLATLGLILGAKYISAWLHQKLPRQIPNWIVAALAVTLAAQLAVLPILVLMDARISIATIFTNLVAVPLASFVMVAGLALTAVALIWLPLAKSLAVVVAVPAWLIAKVAEIGAGLTFLVVPMPKGLFGLFWAFWLCFLVLLFSFNRLKQNPALQRSATSVLLLSVISMWWHPVITARPWVTQDWIVASCDVGQGDATLINLGNHQAVLIDAGPDPDLIDECLHEFRVTTLPLVILTHFHADHVGGITGALRHRKVGGVRVSPLAEPELTTKFAVAILEQRHLKIEPLVAGDAIRIGSVTLNCVWPARLMRGQGSDPNNASLVLHTDISGLRFAFAGDVEAPAQSAIVQSGVLSQVDVLKVAHHGSRNQDQEFARLLSPKVGLISVGRNNDYGHPAPETVLLYETLGTKLFRTDLSGDVAIRAVKGRLEVLTQH